MLGVAEFAHLRKLAMKVIDCRTEGNYNVVGLRKRGRSTVMMLLSLAVIPGFFAIGSWVEHQRRLQVLRHGEKVQALVVKSGNFG